MDALFQLGEAGRANSLRFLIQSFNCTYSCLWSYVPPPSNCLIFLDGSYKEETNQPSSSTGSSLAWKLFIDYQNTIIPLENDIQIPGFAFRNNTPYLEIRDFDLQRLALNQTQRRFYQEAGIKRAVFMGCRAGEIELGVSNESQINMELGMMEFFPEDFSRQSPQPQLREFPHQLLAPPPPDQTPMASTSSSSLRSLSTESPDSSLIFNIPSTSNIVAQISGGTTAAAMDPQEQAMRILSQIRSTTRLPMLETEHNTMTQAFLTVLTSPSTSSTSTSHHRPQPNSPQLNPNSSAFKRYTSSPPLPPQIRGGVRKPNILKQSILYYRNLHIMRRRNELMLGSDSAGTAGAGGRPSTNQLHHMMSERKRREKLNESFQTLKSLLPPGTKRDKASVLARTREYLTSLTEQVAELSRKNQLLEAQLLSSKEEVVAAGSCLNEGTTSVRITQVAAESPSDERIVDLRINIRGECLVVDLMILLLEFLKQDGNISMMSMETNTIEVEEAAGPLNIINFRLKIKTNGWDETAFIEAVRRLVADFAR